MSRRKLYFGIGLIVFNLSWVFVLPFVGMNSFVNNYLLTERDVEADFLAGVDTDTELVFWGYVGCSAICPVTLSYLSSIYKTHTAEFPGHSFGVSFVGLPLPGEENSQRAVDNWAKLYNPDFKGYSLTGNEFSQALREFGVAFAPSFTNPKEVNHTGYIYLLQREEGRWVLRKTYTEYPPNHERILEDLRQIGIESQLSYW
jgi:protein SCO1/2